MTHIYILYFNEISNLTFDFKKCRVHTHCLNKMIKLYYEIDNNATNLFLIEFLFTLIDVDYNIYI